MSLSCPELPKLESYSLYCAYMMKSSKGANQRSDDTNFISRRLEGANSRSERVNSNTVWSVFQKVSCKTYCFMILDLIITQLHSGFQGVILYFNDVTGSVVFLSKPWECDCTLDLKELMILVLRITYLHSGFQGAILYFNDGSF